MFNIRSDWGQLIWAIIPISECVDVSNRVWGPHVSPLCLEVGHSVFHLNHSCLPESCAASVNVKSAFLLWCPCLLQWSKIYTAHSKNSNATETCTRSSSSFSWPMLSTEEIAINSIVCALPEKCLQHITRSIFSKNFLPRYANPKKWGIRWESEVK